MHTKSIVKLVVMLVMLVLLWECECDTRVKTKFKRKFDGASAINNLSDKIHHNVTTKESGRGFFGHGLLSLGKVLNFFPVGGERECQPEGYHVARAGICLNPYDCRQRDGQAAGDCAHGLGVCCIFEVTCGGRVQNNLTYFMSPGFPELWTGESACTITIDKIYAGIMQLRIDFVHFTIGQPNRHTGECDEDAMVLGEGKNNFTICGQNHGQHIYYTLSSGSETREAGELPSTKSTRLSIMMRGSDMPRLWLLRLAQMPIANSAPHDCLQYYTDSNGTIKTFNYARNGRHLARQEYRACIKRDPKHCGIRYTPCDRRSFRIGPSGDTLAVIDPADPDGPGDQGGAGTGFYGPDGSFDSGYRPGPSVPEASTTAALMDQNDMTQQDQMQNQMMQDLLMPVNNMQQTQQDEMEGSGADPQIAPAIANSPPRQSFLSMIWSFIWPSWIWGQARTWRWSPYSQHYSANDKIRYYGYGNFGVGLLGFGRQRCQDRVTIPCENEYFLSSSFGSGVCDPHHCGNTFCPGVPFEQCRVETSITPFAVSFHFGPPSLKRSPEENIGACLRYTQLPCDS